MRQLESALEEQRNKVRKGDEIEKKEMKQMNSDIARLVDELAEAKEREKAEKR